MIKYSLSKGISLLRREKVKHFAKVINNLCGNMLSNIIFPVITVQFNNTVATGG